MLSEPGSIEWAQDVSYDHHDKIAERNYFDVIEASVVIWSRNAVLAVVKASSLGSLDPRPPEATQDSLTIRQLHHTSKSTIILDSARQSSPTFNATLLFAAGK